MRRPFIWTGMVAWLGLVGCGSQPVDVSWPEPRPLGGDVSSYRPPAKPMNPEAIQESEAPTPTGELTLTEAIAATLMRSPALAAYGWEVRAAEARIVEAGLWNNPEFEAEADEFGGTGDLADTRAMETAVSLAQTFPLGGDIERRRELAGYQAKLAGWDYEAARLAILSELTRRYLAVLAAQRRIEVVRDALGLAEDVRETTRKRIEVGAASRIELSRAKVPVAIAQVEVRRAERELRSVRKQLSLMWNEREPGFDRATGKLEALHTPPAAETLARRINQNPAVARWATEISTRLAAAELARAEAIPDVTGRFGAKRFNEIDETAFVVGLSIPVPLFDRNQGVIRAARLETRSAESRQREALIRLEQMLCDALSRLASSYDEVTTLRQEVLPLAWDTFEILREAFQRGDVEFLDVLDAERTLVELRTQHLQALVAYHTAATEIESLIAQPLASVSSE